MLIVLGTLYAMPDASALFVPLRSNGSALLTGTPVESVRRRLKFASVFFDYVFLEEGIFDVSAGPGGSWGGVRAPFDGEVLRWQTPGQRGAEQRRPFTVSVCRDQGPGVVPGPMMPMVFSDSTISWKATLHPFADELPVGTDWISFATPRDPVHEIGRMTDRWKWNDERNQALLRAVPEKFVRSAVIEHANRDLGSGVQHGVAVSVDPLHHQVVAQRFEDDGNWHLVGFAVPILFPMIGGLPWEAIVDALAEAFGSAAEQERDPEKKGKLRQVAGFLQSTGRDVAAEVVSKVILRSAGIG